MDGNNPPCEFREAGEPRFSYQTTELAAVGDWIGAEGGWRLEAGRTVGRRPGVGWIRLSGALVPQ